MKVISFKVNDEVVHTECRELTYDECDTISQKICEVLEVDDVVVEIKHGNEVKSEMDVGIHGMFNYKSLFITPLEGITIKVPMDSDEFINAMVVGDYDRVLKFI